jgi:hypothetical protein
MESFEESNKFEKLYIWRSDWNLKTEEICATLFIYSILRGYWCVQTGLDTLAEICTLDSERVP